MEACSTKLDLLRDCLRPPPCGTAGPRAFRFIFVHALSTRCPRNFWHSVLDSWGRWIPGSIDREFSPSPRRLRTRRAERFSVHFCPRAVHALSTQLLAQRFGSFWRARPPAVQENIWNCLTAVWAAHMPHKAIQERTGSRVCDMVEVPA